MTAPFSGSLGSGSGASVSSIVGNMTLPANCVCLVATLTNDTTPAQPTLTGNGGETWVFIDTVLISTTRRLCLFRTMMDTDTLTAVTINAGASQTAIGWGGQWWSGVDTTGTWGANAVGTATKGTGSGTSFSFGLTGTDQRNGTAAFFAASTTSAITPRTGFSETLDIQLGASSNRLELQALEGIDPTGSVSASGPNTSWCGIAVEILHGANPVSFRVAFAFDTGAASSTVFIHNVDVIKGRQYFVHFCLNHPQSATIDATGYTFTVEQSFATSGTSRKHYVWRMSIPTVSSTVTIRLTRSSTGSIHDFRIIEVANFDPSVGSGTGIIQSKAETVNANGEFSFTLDDPVSDRANGMLIMAVGFGTSNPPTGWKQGYSTGTSGFGGLWRTNADDAPSVYLDGGTVVAGGIFFEFAGTEEFSGSPPVITLVDPPEGAIDPDDVIIVDFTDVDDDITFIIPIFTFTGHSGELAHVWGVGFEPAYITNSTLVAITNGWRFSFDRGGWPANMSLTAYAFDSEGHLTVETFSWGVAEPAFDTCINPGGSGNRPTVQFVSPPLGQAVYRYTAVTFRVLCSAPMRRMLVRARYAGRAGWDFLYDGTEFGPNFQGVVNGVVSLDSATPGFEFTVLRDGGWPAPPEFTVYPITVLGLEEE